MFFVGLSMAGNLGAPGLIKDVPKMDPFCASLVVIYEINECKVFFV